MIRIYLHLGLQSSESAAFQRFMTERRDAFLTQGVLFPYTGAAFDDSPSGPDLGHAGLLPAFQRADLQGMGYYFRRSLLDEILTANVESVLLSSESFLHPRRGADPAWVMRTLQGIGTVYPVVYLSRQDRYVESEYLWALGQPGSELVSGVGAFARSRMRSGWFDFRTRLKPWAAVFGDDLVVRSYDDLLQRRTTVSEDLLRSVVGLSSEGLAPPAPPALLRPDLANLARAINGASEVTDDFKVPMLESIAGDAVHSEPSPGVEGSLIDDDLWAELSERYRADNRWLSANLISGETSRFQFEDQRPSRLAEQTHDLAQARELVARWLSGHSADVEAAAAGSKPPPRSSRTLKLGITSVVRAPLEQIHNWINYHLAVGIDEIVVFVDGPPFHESLATVDRVTVVNCDDDFWRSMFVVAPKVLDEKLIPMRRLGQRILESKGMNWIAGVDSDELIYGDVRDDLARVQADVDVLRMLPAEAVQHDGMEAVSGFESRVFKRRPSNSREHREAVASEYATVAPFTRLGFFGHIEGKAFVKAGTQADFWGSHGAINTRRPLERRIGSRSLVLHFDSRPFDRWCERWRRKLSALTDQSSFGTERSNMFKHLSDLLSAGDDDALREAYKTWYFMDSERIDRLESLGLVSRVNIPEAWFSEPGPAAN